MYLFVIRHGEPDYEHDSLTPTGQKQAEAVAKRLMVHGIDKVYSSPKGRARLTAKPLCDALGLEMHIEPWCSEDEMWPYFAGHYEGLGYDGWAFQQPWQNLRGGDNFNLGNADWLKADLHVDIKAEEGYKRLIPASDDFMERLGYRREGSVYKILRPGNNDRVALFCHEGFSMAWMPFMLGIPPHLFWSAFAVTPSGITCLYFHDWGDVGKGYTVPHVLGFSDMSHIFHDGLPMNFNGYAEV